MNKTKGFTPGVMDRVWNAVYDSQTLETDADAARNLADSVKIALQESNTLELQKSRQQMATKLGRIGKSILFSLITVISLVLIAWGIRGVFRSNDNDYAGYGPNNVNKHSMVAVTDYFAPKRVDLEKRKKDEFGGQKAWASQYLVDNKRICVYVWGGTNINDQYKVEEGRCN